MKDFQGQGSLFDLPDMGMSKEECGVLEIVSATFNKVNNVRWEELFDGFDELYAITFSSGIQFAADLLQKFRTAEIIFGDEHVISTEMTAIISKQIEIIKSITKSKASQFFIEKIEADELQLYVAKDIHSHEKIYCMKSLDGKKRVITGSANMSYHAFKGLQRENIICMDGDEAYDYYYNLFCNYRDECASEIAKETLVKSYSDGNYIIDHIDEVPIIKEVNKAGMVIVEASTESDEREIEYVAKVQGMEAELKPMLPKPKKENGKKLLTSEHIKKFTKTYKEEREVKKIKEKKFPKLHLSYEKSTLDFNGVLYNMTPSSEQIKSDVQCLMDYLSSLQRFSGDVLSAEKDYYAFLNWCFATIFMPKLRYVASKTNYEITDYPVIGILYGESNAGKTTFVKLIRKLMTGRDLPICQNSDFTKSNIEDMKRGWEGVPIYIDDLVKNQYSNHAENVIKDDYWGIAEHFENYPAVIITTNSVPSLKYALAKRTVSRCSKIRIDKEEGSKCAKMINESIYRASSNLYCEYIRRMMPRISQMVENMEKNDVNYYPDIFKVSSETLYEIISEYLPELPEYVTTLSHSDYFGERALGKNARDKVIVAWETEPKFFDVDKKRNRLIYRSADSSTAYELKYLENELPAKLEAKVNQGSLVMNLTEAREFFGLQFSKSIFGNK